MVEQYLAARGWTYWEISRISGIGGNQIVDRV